MEPWVYVGKWQNGINNKLLICKSYRERKLCLRYISYYIFNVFPADSVKNLKFFMFLQLSILRMHLPTKVRLVNMKYYFRSWIFTFNFFFVNWLYSIVFSYFLTACNTRITDSEETFAFFFWVKVASIQIFVKKHISSWLYNAHKSLKPVRVPKVLWPNSFTKISDSSRWQVGGDYASASSDIALLN